MNSSKLNVKNISISNTNELNDKRLPKILKYLVAKHSFNC